MCLFSYLSNRKRTSTEQEDREGGASQEIAETFAAIKNEIFSSGAFVRYLERLTSLKPTGYKYEIRRFRPGLDYSVAHFGSMTRKPRLDATLCFVDTGIESMTTGGRGEAEEEEEEEEEEECDGGEWEGGDLGGYECYVAAEDNADEHLEAAEVFQQEKNYGSRDHEEKDEEEDGNEDADEDDDNQLLSISPGCNVLSLVMRNENIMRFIKYVSHNAPGSRWDIAVDYEIESNEEDDDSDGEIYENNHD
jgi:hypothetical protein